MSRSRPALVRLGKEFIKGYCALVEGEKDPRNLMLSFGIIHVIVIEFDLTDCVEVGRPVLVLVKDWLCEGLTRSGSGLSGSVRRDFLLLPDHVHTSA